MEDLRAIENEQIEERPGVERDKKTTDHHAGDVHDEEQGGDVDRVTPNPTDRLIIIRGYDAEHHNSKRPSFAQRKFAPRFLR